MEGAVTELRPDRAMAAIEISGSKPWMPDVGRARMGKPEQARVRARDVSLTLGPAQGHSIRNQIPARITSIDTDQDVFAEIGLDAAGQTSRARVSRMVLDEVGLAEGQEVWALIKSIAFDLRLT